MIILTVAYIVSDSQPWVADRCRYLETGIVLSSIALGARRQHHIGRSVQLGLLMLHVLVEEDKGLCTMF